MRSFFRKDSTMRSKFLLIALGSALAGCNTMPDAPSKGVAAVNVPVVTSTDYVFDAAAPGGALAPGEGQRLNGWFQGLGLGYGDTVYVDGASPEARSQIAAIAGRYGMLVTPGAPVTAGMVQPGSARVVVARRRAEVPELEQDVPARLE
jgi:pilus assembly protein CpaD